MKYILVSYFNSNNLGDILLSNQLYENLKRCIDIIPCSFEGDFSIPKDILYKNNYKKRFQKKIFKRNKCFWDEFENKIKYSDGLIIGGGNMIMDIETYSTLDRFIKYIEIAIKYKKKIIISFVGVGPINDMKKFQKIKDYMTYYNFINVRDLKSLEYFNDTKVVQTYDPAFLLPQKECNKKRGILINIINSDTFDKGKFEYYKDFYIRLLTRLYHVKCYNNISLIITESSDIKMAKEIIKTLGKGYKIKLYSPKTTYELIDYISTSEFVIGSRMHFMIIAYTQKVPFVGLKWQEKVESFFKNIKLEENCFNFIESSIDEIINTYESESYKFMYTVDILKRKESIIKNIKSNIKKINEITLE